MRITSLEPGRVSPSPPDEGTGGASVLQFHRRVKSAEESGDGGLSKDETEESRFIRTDLIDFVEKLRQRKRGERRNQSLNSKVFAAYNRQSDGWQPDKGIRLVQPYKMSQLRCRRLDRV